MVRASDVATSAYRSVRGLLVGKAYKYNAIPEDEGERDELDEHRESYSPDLKRRLLALTITAMTIAVILSLALSFR